MAENRRFALTPQLDIEQLLQEAQHRWLRPVEICEILRNYQKFRIAPEPPNRPPSGSLFLFDRKVLRYFRKDGHKWKKKKDGKTVKEAHERLKLVLHATGVRLEVLMCCTAIMLMGKRMKTSKGGAIGCWKRISCTLFLFTIGKSRVVKQVIFKLEMLNKMHKLCMGTVLPVLVILQIRARFLCKIQMLEARLIHRCQNMKCRIRVSKAKFDAADKYQANSRYHSVVEVQQYGVGPVTDVHLLNSYVPMPLLNDQFEYQRLQATGPASDFHSIGQEDATRGFDKPGIGLTLSESKSQFGLTTWEEVGEHCTTGLQRAPFDPTIVSTQAVTLDSPKQYSLAPGGYFTDDLSLNQRDVAGARGNPVWQVKLGVTMEK